MNTPRLSFWQIWNMSFGFLGIQFGWGLQMANMSAIYQYLGAEESEIPLLWLAAPITGLIVQPIIGYYSDRTWTFLGRRRPYFLVGAILASLSLIAMPNSSTLWMAAGLLWILDASVNVSMEPFRAFVGDMLPKEQRKTGFAMQSLLIGLGAVASSSLPWLFSNVFGITSDNAEGAIPLSVKLSFYIGSGVFFFAVLYTILTTKEKPPANLEEFKAKKEATQGVGHMFVEIAQGIGQMPKAMRQLSVSQFFTWFGLFCMWIYFSPAIATQIFGGKAGTPEYQQGIEWAGVCFSTYNGVAFAFSFVLIALTKRFTAKQIHTVCLSIGAIGLLSILVVTSPNLLLLSMVGVGIAWASILSMPYAMLSNVIPGEKMGFYMGVFNFFIVLPQIIASLGLGKVMEHLLNNNAMLALALGGGSFIIATISLRWVHSTE
ncbi:MAG: MFS transporter [Verrucomicrobiota bacterium]